VSAKAKIALIFALCAAPIVFGTLAYLLGWHGQAGNYGELIPPRTLEAPAFQPLRGKWVLVTFDPASCGPACERKLYVVRQVRRAQGAGAERIDRLWLVTGGGAPKPELLAAIAGSYVQPAERGAKAGEFPGDPERYIYLVDPLGNLMMRYPREPDPAKMIKDLERLLKVSRVG
jgi:cytochrome oxidase Cu insertion factor (SCO1/SenC/PrrC family)